jgi:hypothetical protein
MVIAKRIVLEPAPHVAPPLQEDFMLVPDRISP